MSALWQKLTSLPVERKFAAGLSKKCMTIADMESIADGKETSKWSMPKLKANFILVPMKD